MLVMQLSKMTIHKGSKFVSERDKILVNLNVHIVLGLFLIPMSPFNKQSGGRISQLKMKTETMC